MRLESGFLEMRLNRCFGKKCLVDSNQIAQVDPQGPGQKQIMSKVQLNHFRGLNFFDCEAERATEAAPESHYANPLQPPDRG